MSHDRKKRRLKTQALILDELTSTTRKFRSLYETGSGLTDFFTIWPGLFEDFCETGKTSLYDVIRSKLKSKGSEIETSFWSQVTARFKGVDEDDVKFTKDGSDYNAAKILGARAAFFKLTRVENIDTMGQDFGNEEGADIDFNYDVLLQHIFMIVPSSKELESTVENFVTMLGELEDVVADIEKEEFNANDDRESKKKKKRALPGEPKEIDFNGEQLKLIRESLTEYVHEFVEAVRGSQLFMIDIDKAKRSAKERVQKEKKERAEKSNPPEEKEKEKESE